MKRLTEFCWKQELFSRLVYIFRIRLLCAACLLVFASRGETISELDFKDFFLSPIGPKGLELSPKIRGLDGKLVRVRGYVVEQNTAPEGRLLLTAIPIQLHDEHYGLADDLPAATLFVSVSSRDATRVRHSRGPIALQGRLELGNKEEADGRISIVRLAAAPVRSPQKNPASAKGEAASPDKNFRQQKLTLH